MWRLMGPLAAACFVVFLSVLPARAQSAEDMLQACEALEQGMRVVGGHPYLPRRPDVQQCWGFMEAVQQYATLADQDGKTLLDACPSPDSTTIQVVHVFTDYARAHPDKLGLKAAAVAYNAMADAFPCK